MVTKYLAPILVLSFLIQIGVVLADTQECLNTVDCNRDDEVCTYTEEAEYGQCLREATIKYREPEEECNPQTSFASESAGACIDRVDFGEYNATN